MEQKLNEIEINGIKYVRKNSVESKKEEKVIELNGSESVWVVGKNYLIRTVTMIQIGKLIRVTGKELMLEKACWVADTGRFSTALKEGKLNEVEMFLNPVIVGRGAIVDATEWIHDLPTTTK